MEGDLQPIVLPTGRRGGCPHRPQMVRNPTGNVHVVLTTEMSSQKTGIPQRLLCRRHTPNARHRAFFQWRLSKSSCRTACEQKAPSSQPCRLHSALEEGWESPFQGLSTGRIPDLHQSPRTCWTSLKICVNPVSPALTALSSGCIFGALSADTQQTHQPSTKSWTHFGQTWTCGYSFHSVA